MRFPAKITSSCIWVAIPVDWVISYWYACGADGRSLGRAVGRCTVTWLRNFLGWVDYFIFLSMVLRWLASRARAPLLIAPKRPYDKYLTNLRSVITGKSQTSALTYWYIKTSVWDSPVMTSLSFNKWYACLGEINFGKLKYIRPRKGKTKQYEPKMLIRNQGNKCPRLLW